MKKSRSTQTEVSALQKKARMLLNMGRFSEAENTYQMALECAPDALSLLNEFGTLCLQQGKLEQGKALLLQSAALKPDQAEVLTNLGGVCRELRNLPEALSFLERSLRLEPRMPRAYFNRGNIHHDLGELDKAVSDYERAVAYKPDYFQAWFNLGNVFKEQNLLTKALECFDRAIGFNPEFVPAYYNRGAVLNAVQRHDDSLLDCNFVASRMPQYADAHYNLGNAYRALGKHMDSLVSYDRAIALKPDYSNAHSNRGNALRDMGLHNEALEACIRAVELEPASAEFHSNCGNAYLILGQFPAAVKHYLSALAIAPELPYVRGALLHCEMQLCEWENFERYVHEINTGVAAGKKASTPFFYMTIPSTAAQQMRCAQIFVQDKFSKLELPVLSDARPVNERVRIGYFSSDFRNHAMGYLIAEMIERHDRSKFEIFAFSFSVEDGSAARKRLERAFDHFIDASEMTDREVVNQSRALGIDIAIDLNGFTANARTNIFGMRAAPVQVNHLGYPGTMGASFIDYIIGDKTVIPPTTSRYFSEKIVHLPHTYWFNDSTKEIANRQYDREELGLPKEGFVFCCFNNSYKITPDVFAIWMDILRRVEGSVLWLLQGNDSVVSNLKREAQKLNVSPERLVFASRMSLAEHLARHRQANMFLDTFYYNAHTTASDALWTGLPVITLPGEAFPSRVAASMLKAVGLPELIVNTREEYGNLAVNLATNPAALFEIKSKLERNIKSYPLFHTALYTRNIERAYELMWQKHKSGMPPEYIEIEAQES